MASLKAENIKTITVNILKNEEKKDVDTTISQLQKIVSNEKKNLNIIINSKFELTEDTINLINNIPNVKLVLKKDTKLFFQKHISNFEEEDIKKEIEKKIDIQVKEKNYYELDNIVLKKAIRSGHITKTNNLKIIKENINHGGVLEIENGLTIIMKNNNGKIFLKNGGILFSISNNIGIIENQNFDIENIINKIKADMSEKDKFIYININNENIEYDKF